VWQQSVRKLRFGLVRCAISNVSLCGTNTYTMWYKRVSRWYENGWYKKTLVRKTRLPRWLTTRATTFFLNQLLALIKNGHDFIASKDKEKKSHLPRARHEFAVFVKKSHKCSESKFENKA